MKSPQFLIRESKSYAVSRPAHARNRTQSAAHSGWPQLHRVERSLSPSDSAQDSLQKLFPACSTGVSSQRQLSCSQAISFLPDLHAGAIALPRGRPRGTVSAGLPGVRGQFGPLSHLLEEMTHGERESQSRERAQQRRQRRIEPRRVGAEHR
jgi:hypothetical protein